MPNCYSLTPKANPADGPMRLVQIDELMCAHFGVVPHEVKWYLDWENNVGLALACGKSFKEIRETFEKNEAPSEYLAMIDWLDANFTPDAWAEVGRR